MKKLIILAIFLLFFPVVSHADCTVVVGGVAASGDDCSGDLNFSWHAENTDLASEDGCTSGASTTFAANASPELSSTQKHDGTTSAYFNADNEWYEIGVNSSVITGAGGSAEGKITFLMYVETYDADETVLRIVGDSNDYLEFQMTGGAGAVDLLAIWQGNGTTDTITCNANKAEDVWIYVEYQYKDGVDGNDTILKMCDSDGVSNCTTETVDDDPNALTNDFVTLYVGTTNQDNLGLYIDKVKIYGTAPDL